MYNCKFFEKFLGMPRGKEYTGTDSTLSLGLQSDNTLSIHQLCELQKFLNPWVPQLTYKMGTRSSLLKLFTISIVTIYILKLLDKY